MHSESQTSLLRALVKVSPGSPLVIAVMRKARLGLTVCSGRPVSQWAPTWVLERRLMGRGSHEVSHHACLPQCSPQEPRNSPVGPVHPKQGACADQSEHGHSSGRTKGLLLRGNMISAQQSYREKADARAVEGNVK